MCTSKNVLIDDNAETINFEFIWRAVNFFIFLKAILEAKWYKIWILKKKKIFSFYLYQTSGPRGVISFNMGKKIKIFLFCDKNFFSCIWNHPTYFQSNKLINLGRLPTILTVCKKIMKNTSLCISKKETKIGHNA